MYKLVRKEFSNGAIIFYAREHFLWIFHVDHMLGYNDTNKHNYEQAVEGLNRKIIKEEIL